MQKKIAVVEDFSGYGRCSASVSMPVISAMQLQCCLVPTAVFSNHTGYPDYFFDDYTDKMPEYIDKWEKLGLKFDGIYSGFLGSERQVEIVSDFIDDFKKKDARVIVDPVMGDNGKTYATCTSGLCASMSRLAAKADILTPNLTEACILTGRSYHDSGWKRDEIFELAAGIHELGPEQVVITGIRQGKYISNFVCDSGEDLGIIRTRRAESSRCGTGDLFASIIAADAVNGVPFVQSVRRASRFIRRCILKSDEMGVSEVDGVCFEEFLYQLHDRRSDR